MNRNDEQTDRAMLQGGQLAVSEIVYVATVYIVYMISAHDACTYRYSYF